MAPLVVLCAGVVLAQPQGDIGAVEATETLPLVRTGSAAPVVEVDALGGRVTVRGAAIRGASTLCPSVERRAAATTLRCGSLKVRARLEPAGTKGAPRSVLVLSRMRGAPALDGDATLPLFSYAVPELGLAPCAAPGEDGAGKSASVRGECALAEGNFDEAIAAFAQALDEQQHAHAALRLGDIAWLVDDVTRAAAFWDSVGTAGLWTRLAAARLCDVLGSCARQRGAGLRFDPLDAGGLPDVAFDEIVLRRARGLAYDGRPSEAVTLLVAQGQRACGRAPALCRRLALEAALAVEAHQGAEAAAKAGPTDPRATEVMALVLTVGFADDDTSAALVGRVAEQLARVGVPRLGAELLVSTKRDRSSSEAHLVRAAELYLESGEPTQAATIARYVNARRVPSALASRWRAVEASIAGAPAAGGGATRSSNALEVHR